MNIKTQQNTNTEKKRQAQSSQHSVTRDRMTADNTHNTLCDLSHLIHVSKLSDITLITQHRFQSLL